MDEKEGLSYSCNQNPDQDNLRTEYTSISQFFNTVVTFRFTTLSLYLAAVGFIFSGSLSDEKYILLIGISVPLWLIELRNRSLYKELAGRGMQIEREYWGYKGPRAYESFYSRIMRIKPQDSEAPDPPPPANTVLWNREIRINVSHTKAFDLLYLFIIAFSAFNLIV